MARSAGSGVLARKLGARIRRLRHGVELTQEQLALDTNLTPGFIALVESGARLPSLGVLVALATALRCDLPELLCVEVTDPRADLLAALRRRDWSAVAIALDRLGYPPSRP